MSNKDSTLARIQAAMAQAQSAVADMRYAKAIEADARTQAHTIAEASHMGLDSLTVHMAVDDGDQIVVMLALDTGKAQPVSLKDMRSLVGWANKHLGPGAKAQEEKT